MAFAIPAVRAIAAPGLAVDRLRDSCGAWTRARFRPYRADVVIALMGVPIFSRRAAGSACAMIRESEQNGRKTLSLRFAGGADPKRTHGVNYSGCTEEIAIEGSSGLAEAASFGFVTSSNEESFDQARHRVMEGTGGQERFVIVDELHQASRVRVRKAVASAPGTPCSGLGQLARTFRSRLSETNFVERDIALPAPTVPSTFLYSMLGAARATERSAAFHYAHNGKLYKLDYEKIPAGAGVTRLNARIHDFETRRNSTFKLWLEDGSDLPVRIEFSPRSYLRITLESDPEVQNAFDPTEEL